MREMPYRTLPASEPSRITGRVALMGPPNSWKSATLVGDTPTPRHVVVIPGEKGWETMRGAPDTLVDIWELEDVTAASPHQVVREVETQVNTILSSIQAGKEPTRFLAIDGLHKFYGWVYKRERLNLNSWPSADKMGPDTLDARAYMYAHDAFMTIVTRWLSHRAVPYIWVTFWEGRSKDDPDNRDPKAPTHIFPDLPGQMAKWIVGEFSAVLYHDVGPPGPQGKQRGEWVLKPEGRIWGVGIKGRPEVSAKLPARVPIGFKNLARLLGEPEE